MRNLVESVLTEPRSPNAPLRVRRDWYLVGAIAASVIIESAMRSGSQFRAASVLTMVVLIVSVLRRRTSPLLSVAATFGVVILVNLVLLVTDGSPLETYSAAWALILGYSLFRWGSGREVISGLAIMVLALIVGTAASYTGIGDAIGGAVFLLFPAVLGVSVRTQTTVRAQHGERIKMEERAQIARELHDTVAHHVSAIAVAAQAGRVLAQSNSLDGATSALATIEEEASRTLMEMRSMVGLLRSGGSPVAPWSGIAELHQLAVPRSNSKLSVKVELSGNLESVADPVSSAVFRLVQESVTNATRHAVNATEVRVRVDAKSGTIHLTISDDGAAISGSSYSSGYGLIGMSERVSLLGGTFEAGPGAEHGWLVQVELPQAPSAP